MMISTPLLIEAFGLHKRFGAVQALKGVDLLVAQGELVCVTGPSGSGKTTLLRCLARLETPDSGSVSIGGIDLLDPRVDIARARRRVGLVCEPHNLHPHLTALANLALALQQATGVALEEAELPAQAALARVGLADRAATRIWQLSADQQLRVAIARAVMLQPRAMLFDDPTASLDPRLVGTVLAVLRELRADGMTMVVASHAMGFARAIADRVVEMLQGAILQPARTEAIVTQPEHGQVPG
jgi:polar amino acid transport system ATP-binding protein